MELNFPTEKLRNEYYRIVDERIDKYDDNFNEISTAEDLSDELMSSSPSWFKSQYAGDTDGTLMYKQAYAEGKPVQLLRIENGNILSVFEGIDIYSFTDIDQL